MFNLHQLRVYAAVIEEASFTAAASRLFLTQPAVSAQIRRLRQIVGSELVVRDGHRIVATDAGNALYRYACDVLTGTESLWQQLQEISTGAVDHVTVGGSHAYGAYVLPQLLVEFRRGHPSVQFSLVDGAAQEILGQVRSGRIDVGIVTSERVPKDLVVSSLGIDEPIIIDSASDPVVKANELAARRLVGRSVCPNAGWARRRCGGPFAAGEGLSAVGGSYGNHNVGGSQARRAGWRRAGCRAAGSSARGAQKWGIPLY